MVKKSLKVIWDNEAKKSLQKIYQYIKARESVAVAKRVVNETILRLTKILFYLP
jgi:plasmid stabilization system protein ParE